MASGPQHRPSNALLERHHAYVKGDNTFQRRARLLQSLWREQERLPIGEHRGSALGSRLAMPVAKDELLNYLTDTIRDVVRREVLDPERSKGKLYKPPRIFNDLLSSQPMCFNLFGELQADLQLATAVFRKLSIGRIHEVNAIEFEHSPGRGDPKHTGDKSAFDVYVEYTTRTESNGFIGIEVKYHEDLSDQAAPHRERYDEIADAMGIFKDDARDQLKKKPLQQIWRDHLLAGSLLLDPDAGLEDGFFVFLHPRDNDRCTRAVGAYRACLTDETMLVAWTLEDVVATLKAADAGPWVDAFEDRYLDFRS